MSTIRWVWRRLGPHRRDLVLAMVWMAVVALTRAAYAAMVGPALGLLLHGEAGAAERTALLTLAGLTIAVAAVKAVAWTAQRLAMGRAGQGLVAGVRTALYAHLLTLDPAALHAHRRGDLATRVATDTRQLLFLIDPGLENVLRIVVTVIVVGAYTIWLDPWLGTLALLAWPVLVVLMVRAARRARVLEHGEAGDRGALAGRVAELVGMIPVVRAMGAEPVAQAAVAREIAGIGARAVAAARLHARTGPLLEAVTAVGAALLLVGVGLSSTGPVDVAHLGSLLGACFFLYAPVRALGYTLETASWGAAAIDRVEAMLTMRPEAPDAPDAVEATFHRALVLRDLRVSFGATEVLRGVELRVVPGESVAIVGRSGAGKSTLFSVLLGLVAPSGGTFTVDEVPVGQLRRASLRRLFGWVTQEPQLFADSVAANVVFGGVLDPGRLAAALRDAGAEAFVSALPQGADTVLAEGGAPLSVGERQRLCIARALYRDAPVLLLDEPTSALDGAAEAALAETIEALVGARTVLVTTHRLSTLRRCGRVVVLEEGRIVQDGPLAAVWTPDSAFARLFGPPP